MTAKFLGRYIIYDPSICHGAATFRGTRILVKDVLEQLESGMAWEAITEEWRGTITRDAIAEAIRLAREALSAHTPEMTAQNFYSYGSEKIL